MITLYKKIKINYKVQLSVNSILEYEEKKTIPITTTREKENNDFPLFN